MGKPAKNAVTIVSNSQARFLQFSAVFEVF